MVVIQYGSGDGRRNDLADRHARFVSNLDEAGENRIRSAVLEDLKDRVA